MKKNFSRKIPLFRIIFAAFSLSFVYYLLIPISQFPEKGGDFVVSTEPADVESVNRRGYFTDMTRSEVINHYSDKFSLVLFGFVRTSPLRLNYPPEEARVLIRDQTRSTFLEELVFPFRESLYINGFEPKDDKDAIIIDGKRYRQKVIVKHVESSVLGRVSLGIASVILLYFLVIRILGDTGKFFAIKK